MRRNWNEIEITFEPDADNPGIYWCYANGINEAQLRQFANLVFGCSYSGVFKGKLSTVNAYSRFGKGSELGKKLNGLFRLWLYPSEPAAFSFDCPECNARMFSDYAECFCGWVNVNRVAL